MTRTRFRVSGRLLAAAVVVTVVGAGTAFAAPIIPDPPPLRLVGVSKSVTVERYEGEPVFLNLGTHIVAGKNSFEIQAKRTDYSKPIEAKQIIRSGGRERAVPLPSGLLKDFSGFTDFTHLTVVDAKGKTVAEQNQSFCPNSFFTTRTRPDAPDTTPYPFDCPRHAFTVGGIYGLQAGWSVPTSGGGRWGGGEPTELADGNFTVKVSINKKYRDAFKIPNSEVSVAVTVKTIPLPEDPGEGGPGAKAKKNDPKLQPAAKRPTGKPSVPKGPKPDLRSLPATDIQIGTDEWPPDAPPQPGPKRDELSFSAIVWTAGDSPLVVDGFRRGTQDVMDAFQYFFDDKGKQVGFAPVGTMEYDRRDQHNHWHFVDFAQYRLLDADKKLAVRSGKEAFCLANTDAVDYTLKHANWRPVNRDLHTACGDEGSLAVREVLDVGNGDEYRQSIPGQSFDITDVPNGTYYIEVTANPDGKLFEKDKKNNTALRKVILGGKPGKRTVTVPPHQGIDG
jgi:hypothetical protein